MVRYRLDPLSGFERRAYDFPIFCPACKHRVDVNAVFLMPRVHEKCLSKRIDELEFRLHCSDCASKRTLTYAALSKQLGLEPPNTIHRTGLLLEDLMRAQAAKAEPQLASCVVSRARAGLSAPGFFMMMRGLGLYDGPDTGAKARKLVEDERARSDCSNSP